MKRTMYFTTDEAQLALAIVGGLDPATYKHAVAKSLILKCKAYNDGDYTDGVIR